MISRVIKTALADLASPPNQHSKPVLVKKLQELIKEIETEIETENNLTQNAIKIDPNHFKAYYNRAFCWDKLGRYSESEADY